MVTVWILLLLSQLTPSSCEKKKHREFRLIDGWPAMTFDSKKKFISTFTLKLEVGKASKTAVVNMNYPENYPEGSIMTYELNNQDTTTMTKFFCDHKEFKVGDPTLSCENTDYMEVLTYNRSNWKYLGKFCHNTPPDFEFEEKTAIVKLVSSLTLERGSKAGRGYVCRVMNIGKVCPCGDNFLEDQRRLIPNTFPQNSIASNEFPWVAIIQDATSTRKLCMGTIVHEYFVLTAAACLLQSRYTDLRIIVGRDKFVGVPEDQKLKAQGFMFYSSNKAFTATPIAFQHDTGVLLIKLETPLQMGMYVQKVCIFADPFSKFNAHDFTGEQVYSIGFGSISPGSDPTTNLVKFPVDIVSKFQCENKFGHIRNSQNSFCAKMKPEVACAADMGSPIMLAREDKYFLLAFFSYGTNCENSNHVYGVWLRGFSEWINDIMRTHDCYPRKIYPFVFTG